MKNFDIFNVKNKQNIKLQSKNIIEIIEMSDGTTDIRLKNPERLITVAEKTDIILEKMRG